MEHGVNIGRYGSMVGLHQVMVALVCTSGR